MASAKTIPRVLFSQTMSQMRELESGCSQRLDQRCRAIRPELFNGWADGQPLPIIHTMRNNLLHGRNHWNGFEGFPYACHLVLQ
jgi:hypothetical protein